MNEVAEGLYDTELSNEENVLNLIKAKGEITRRDVEKLLDSSSFPATNILNELLRQNQIVKVGSARATKYTIKK